LITDLQKMAKAGSVDLVLQFCDEGYMNNARMELHVTAFLEMVGIPYTGTGPVALGITYDKQIVLDIAKSIGIPVPQSVLVEKDEDIIPSIRRNNLEFPLFVKPNCTDGSYGITTRSICYNDDDIMQAVKMIRDSFFVVGPILIQEYLEGNDLNTAVIGNFPNMKFLPITEEDYSEVPPELPRVLGFESKWDENSPYFRIGTILAKSVSEETKNYMNECSAKLCKRIGLRDYVRFDWKLDSKGKPRLLEANPNCGWSYDAHMQRMCALADISYSQMLRMILDSARERLLDHFSKAKEEKTVNMADVSKVRLSEKQVAPNAKGVKNL
jgi:D-alanine-D-alanine ligase